MKSKLFTVLSIFSFFLAFLVQANAGIDHLSLSVKGMESLADGEGDPIIDVSRCDLRYWVRNATEDWDIQMMNYTYSGGLNLSYKRFGPLAFTGSYGRNIIVQEPICRAFFDNCCDKQHVSRGAEVL